MKGNMFKQKLLLLLVAVITATGCSKKIVHKQCLPEEDITVIHSPEEDINIICSDIAVGETFMHKGTEYLVVKNDDLTLNANQITSAILANKRICTSHVTNMDNLFNPDGYNSFSKYDYKNEIGKWDTSSVTSMKAMFKNLSTFNEDISKWNVSNVTNMNSMFYGATAFNGDISHWNLRSVTNMEFMLAGATAFTQNISGWKTPELKFIGGIFNDNAEFIKHNKTSDNTLILNWEPKALVNENTAITNINSEKPLIKIKVPDETTCDLNSMIDYKPKLHTCVKEDGNYYILKNNTESYEDSNKQQDLYMNPEIEYVEEEMNDRALPGGSEYDY